jgi:ATP-dependent RNA helicase HrpB
VLPSLPVDAHVAEIRDALRRHRSLVLVAPPGAGKTTRVPPALVEDGPVFLLQPRRVAARSIAARIADEQGRKLGSEVGFEVRFERLASAGTRLLVATEGILARRLQRDPLLEDFATVVLDEFHERSIHADLALAFLKPALAARSDLRVLVMSATLDPGPVSEFLGGCPVLRVDVRPHPVAVRYAPGVGAEAAVREAIAGPGANVLCFLPGAGEIRDLQSRLGGLSAFPLHGSLSAAEQDAALRPGTGRRVILATNIAETSVTVEGVTHVVDSGWQKVMRYDAERALDRLELERVSAEAAEQRTGRAGRTGPGHAVRLWDARDRLRSRREPEIHRVDLAAPVLEVLAWGADPLTFEWFERPDEDRLRAAWALLERLHAAEGRRLTAVGERMRGLPLPPRLARVFVEAGETARAAAACAWLAEGRAGGARGEAATTESDVLPLLDRMADAPWRVREAARQLARLGERARAASASADDDVALRRALWTGFPDRLARRREPGGSRLLLSSGRGAILARESGVRDAEWLVALDVSAGTAAAGSEALVRLASRVEREWVEPTASEVVHRLEEDSVRAHARDRYDAIVLEERAVPVDPAEAARLVAGALRERGLVGENERTERRLRFAGIEADLPALFVAASAGKTRVPAIDLAEWLDGAQRRELERLAPETIPLPSGRRARLEYREDGTVTAAVKLQELFGLAEAPRIGPRREAVTLELLAPNGRPVQTTRDLRGFWERTYPEVRKELRGRYPKHPWPEDPWTAVPTHRTRKTR